MGLSCDYLVMTVTDSETAELFAELSDRYSRTPVPVSGGRLAYSDLGRFGKVYPSSVYHVRSKMGSDTPGGSAITAYSALTELRPQRIIMVGIAFGVDEHRQKMGSVLVSETIKPYDLKRIGTRVKNGRRLRTVEFRSGETPCTHNLVLLFKAVRKARQDVGNYDPPITFGPILSGQTLVDNKAFRDRLRTQLGYAIGGEMEGAGFWAAAHSCPTGWVIVKAICDWADGNKGVDEDARQAQAARNASRLLFDALDTLN